MALPPNLCNADDASVPRPLGLHASEPTRVLVVDDLAAVRAGLALLIGGDPAWPRVVYTAADGAEALRLFDAVHPHFVLLDVDLAGEDGLALLPRLAADAVVLVLTGDPDDATRRRALRGGACGFVRKGAPGATLLGLLARLTPP